MNFRTDMAYESVLNNQKDSNIKIKETKHQFGIKRFEVNILNEQGAKSYNKPKGRYITIEAYDLYQKDLEFLHYAANMISEALIDCMGNTKFKTVLAVGLGNKHMTADSLGPCTVDKLIITRHLKDEKDDLKMLSASLCALAPGVLGITGIETYDIIKGVAEKIKPDIIITIDALASRSTQRLSSAFQITDTGIVPGAGVGNHRFKLSLDTLGVPVISIGVPLVVYASTLSLDIIEQCFSKTPELILEKSQENKIISSIISSPIGELVVTPKDIDAIVQKCAYVLAVAINLAVHRGLSLEEVVGLIH
ncbi:MAG TPA: GPR endopeptidase [Clostridia bacterium]